MNTVLASHQNEIVALCRSYGVVRLDLFGSAATGGFDDEVSDFDFVADFGVPTPTVKYADRVLGFADALERLLGRRVDVLTAAALGNSRFAQAISASRQSVYDAAQPAAA